MGGATLTRRRFLGAATTVLAWNVAGFRSAFARPGSANRVRLGVVVPNRTGGVPVKASIYEPVGEAARRGAILAGDEAALAAQERGLRFDVLLASSPTPDAAYRAGERLAATEDVSALIGGLGEGQAEALNQVARARGILFLNVGSPDDKLRGVDGSPFTFHVEASATMYLDGLARWFRDSGHHRWFVVYDDTEQGARRLRQARTAIEGAAAAGDETTAGGHTAAGRVVGTASVVRGQPAYQREFDAIRQVEPDVVLLLLDAVDQIAFLGQYESVGLRFAVAGFPDPLTQTRNYFRNIQLAAPQVGTGHRVVLWEPTLEQHGARGLNDRFMSRWAEPMDPTGWSAYQAVKILFETASETGSANPSQLKACLESRDARFDVHKGPLVSFSPSGRQLRQPLYVVKLDPDAPRGHELPDKLARANLVRMLHCGV